MAALLVDRSPTDPPRLFDAHALERVRRGPGGSEAAPARDPGLGPASAGPGPERAARLTLGELVSGVWEGLAARGSASCPVCRGEMVATTGGAGRCRDCGAVLD